ncbi:flagellin lysine-N-methylase [Azohydromonas caseinilytica]|uniref:Lysine-N-methylase n=1 Tax=Azohydromonas caseinilytica TaxID=2728836 RepID=A0A848FJ72_9BURK|nr:flagellin lysine-N-methylase [Azohydromonas caseinilytica]NML18260.1 hypothetical protein [Azohydromonas caseinilytica]
MSELHSARVTTALIPRYVSRFGCIGAACEDNCCTGWAVSIDKKTFKAYRQVKNKELGNSLSENVQRRRSQETNADYARIQLHAETKACPLMRDNLCAVQKNLGESYLSNTCFTYPRVSRKFAGQYELALTLSCPEAARQALLVEDAFEFVEAPVKLRDNVVAEVAPRLGMPLELMNEVRIFCIQLLQTQGLALWEKLAVLGGFCEGLTATLAESGNAAVPALMEEYVAIVEQGLVGDALAKLQPDYAAQAQIFALLWQFKATATGSAVQKSVSEAVSQGLGANGETGQLGSERLVENYSRGIERLHKALEATPRLLEHYILNEMFLELFPFGGASPYEDYLKLISRFGLLRLMLAAQCNANATLPDAVALSNTVQVYCRRFQHDPNFAQQVSQVLNNSGWGKLEKLYRFLRS